MVKVYHHTKMKYVNWFKSYSLNRKTYRHTDSLTDTHADTTNTIPLSHTREENMCLHKAQKDSKIFTIGVVTGKMYPEVFIPRV